jgi:hypothetical protein
MTPSYQKIGALFGATSAGFSSGQDLSAEISGLMEEIRKRRQEFRETGIWKSFPVKEIEEDILMATSVDGILDSLSKIYSLMSTIEEPGKNPSVALAGSGAS